MTHPDGGGGRCLSRRLIGAARGPGTATGGASDDMSVGELLVALGDRSFGWCLVLVGILSLLPMPVGTNMVTALPAMLVAAQMTLGLPRVRMPGLVMRRRIDRRRFQRFVLRLRPVIRPIERMIRPRHRYLFEPPGERLFGFFLLLVAIALFPPIPFAAHLPAAALFVGGIAIVERDGLVAWAAVGLGIVAMLVTVAAGTALIGGAEAIVHHV